MNRPRRHYKDFFNAPPVVVVAPCDRCSKVEALDGEIECFGCREAWRAVWPDSRPVLSGRLSGT